MKSRPSLRCRHGINVEELKHSTMETKKQNEKIITILVAGLVLILAVFGSEFRSYGESANTKIEMNDVFDLDITLEELRGEELFEVEEPTMKTAKLYNEKGELLEMLILLEDETLDEVYAGPQFNRAEFLTSYGSVSVYQVAD